MNGLNSSSNVSHLLLYLLRKNFDCYSTGECTKLYTCFHSYCRKIHTYTGWRCWVWEKDWRHIPNCIRMITGHILWAREPFMFWQMTTRKIFVLFLFPLNGVPHIHYCLIAVIPFCSVYNVICDTAHCWNIYATLRNIADPSDVFVYSPGLKRNAAVIKCRKRQLSCFLPLGTIVLVLFLVTFHTYVLPHSVQCDYIRT